MARCAYASEAPEAVGGRGRHFSSRLRGLSPNPHPRGRCDRLAAVQSSAGMGHRNVVIATSRPTEQPQLEGDLPIVGAVSGRTMRHAVAMHVVLLRVLVLLSVLVTAGSMAQ